VIALIAVLNYSTVHNGQGNAIPRSPVDATIAAQDRVLSEGEKDAAFEALMRAIEAQGPAGPIGRLRMRDPRNEWTHKGAIITRGRSGTNFRLSQVYKGLKVRNGNMTVQLADGQSQPDAALVHAEYVDEIQVDIRPTLSKDRAISIAKLLARREVDALGGPARAGLNAGPNRNLLVREPVALNDDAVLEIHPGEGRGNRKLAWHVSTRENAANGPVFMEAWVDQDGKVL